MTRVGRQAYVSRTISREHDDDGNRAEGECAFIGFGAEIEYEIYEKMQFCYENII